MPDTPGKRQRDAVKMNRRRIKEERRAARKAESQDPLHVADDEPGGVEPLDTDGQPEDLLEPRD
jgi:hypothetical protein